LAAFDWIQNIHSEVKTGMGVLVNDTTGNCICGHSELVHHTPITGLVRGCRNRDCDCVQFTESFEELADRTSSKEDFDAALLGIAQAAIIAEIRWLHSNGVRDYYVHCNDHVLWIGLNRHCLDTDILRERGYSDVTTLSPIKTFNITERRSGQDRRHNYTKIGGTVHKSPDLRDVAFAMHTYLRESLNIYNLSLLSKVQLLAALEYAYGVNENAE
jgi:hypothetical protein